MINWLKNKLTSHLFCTPDYTKVITTYKGLVYLNGEQLSDLELKNLYEETKLLEKLQVWSIMQETLKNMAMETGFRKSTTFDDVKTAKLMLFNLNVQNNIIRSIKTVVQSRGIDKKVV